MRDKELLGLMKKVQKKVDHQKRVAIAQDIALKKKVDRAFVIDRFLPSTVIFALAATGHSKEGKTSLDSLTDANAYVVYKWIRDNVNGDDDSEDGDMEDDEEGSLPQPQSTK
jgi:hypothetical protein